MNSDAMYKPLLTLFLLLYLVSFKALGQENDFRQSNISLGWGSAMLSNGDTKAITMESEFSLAWHKIYSNSLVLNYGYSNVGIYEETHFVHLDLNFFVSPFGNEKKNIFKSGIGISFLHQNSYYQNSYEYQGNDSDLVKPIYDNNHFNSLGLVMLLEDDYNISKRVIVGAKVSLYQFMRGNNIASAVVKVGLNL